MPSSGREESISYADAAGSSVAIAEMPPHGKNQVRALPPGVYFRPTRMEGGGASRRAARGVTAAGHRRFMVPEVYFNAIAALLPQGSVRGGVGQEHGARAGAASTSGAKLDNASASGANLSKEG